MYQAHCTHESGLKTTVVFITLPLAEPVSLGSARPWVLA